MIADFQFYNDEYKGIIVTDEKEYGYFAERASDELALFADRLPKTDEAQTALKKCACAVADILYGDFKLTKYGSSAGKINSESVSGYYSVSYGGQTEQGGVSSTRYSINTAVSKYLGKWLLGAAKWAF